MGVVQVAAKGPLAVDGLAGAKRGRDERSMVRDLDRHRDHIDAGLGDQLLVVCEHRADPEHLACCARRFGAVGAEGPELVVR